MTASGDDEYGVRFIRAWLCPDRAPAAQTTGRARWIDGDEVFPLSLE
jgi:hypothetical protein